MGIHDLSVAASMGACEVKSDLPSATCIAEQDFDSECPKGYLDQGHYCVTSDFEQDYAYLKKDVCPDGFIKDRNRCYFLDDISIFNTSDNFYLSLSSYAGFNVNIKYPL